MMKQNFYYFLILFLSIAMSVGFVSCNDEDLLGDTFGNLHVYIEDENGNDLVAEWLGVEEEEKLCTATYNVMRVDRSDSSYPERLRPIKYSERGKCFFSFSQDHSFFSLGDKAEIIFRLYDTDEYEIKFEGVYTKDPKPKKSSSGSKILYNIQWTFDGTVCPVANPINVILVRTSDGKYTLKSAD